MKNLFRAILAFTVMGILSAQVGGRGGGFPGRGRGNGPPNSQQNPQQNTQPNGQPNAQQNTQQAPPVPTKPEDLGAIEGVVTNAATGEPLKKATVTLRGLNGRGQPAGATSDANGKFSLPGVEPGRYRLFAEHNGFVRQEYGARGPERTGTALTVDKAQRLTSISLRVTPQAVITGRILDEDGEPVNRVMVQAMRMGYNQGRRQLVRAGSATTNDLGEYRLYDIPGGKYYVSAMVMNSPQAAVGKDRYVPSYYPGTHDPVAALQLDVPAGVQMRGIDMTLRRAPTVSVRGKIVSAATNAPSRGSMVRLVTRGSGLAMNLGQGAPGRGQGGAFEITGVLPGSYTLVADVADQRKRFTYRQPIEVGAGGVDGLTVTIPAPADLTGQVRAEGQGEVDLSRLTMSLRLQDGMPGAGPTGRAKADGSFLMEGLMQDNYQLTVSGLPVGYYVKSARFGDAEILDSGLNLTGGATGKLEVTISPGAAQLEGVVRDAKQEFAKAALVALIPEASRRSQTALFKTTRTDDNGHYSLEGITPGSYLLYAFEDIETGAYFDPDFMKPLENSAQSVNLAENSHEIRELKEIPATE